MITAILKDDRILLNTRATPAIMALLPVCEGRRHWLKGGGLSLEDTHHNRSMLADRLGVHILDGPEPISQFKPTNSWTCIRQPDPHQAIALERISQRKVFGLFSEQGTGKTKVAVDWANKLHSEGKITGVVVISKRGVHRQWAEVEIPKDSSPGLIAEYWRGKPPSDALLEPSANGLVWWTINYDGLKTKVGMAATEKFCRAHSGKLMAMCDESQEIKNTRSGRHKAALVIKQYSSYRLLLTGTPIAKDLTDEWAQLKWLDENIIGCRYLTTFRAQYCIMGGYEGREIIGQKNMDSFKAKVDPWTYRITKEEIGYIPKRRTEWVFDMTAEQKRLIKQIKSELIAEIKSGQIIDINGATGAFNKLQQVSNGFLIDSETSTTHRIIQASSNPRALNALDWLNAGEGKAIFWARFREDMRILEEVMDEHGVTYASYHGGINSKLQQENLDQFKSDPGVRVFLANPKSAGTGIDGLQRVCGRALYYSNSFDAIDRWQSEDRIHRRDMVDCLLTDLIAVGSLDRYIARNLAKKKGISEMSLGDMVSAIEGI